MSEPRFQAAGDNARVPGFVQKLRDRGLIRSRRCLREQGAVDFAPGDARHLQQPHALRRQPGQPSAQGLRHAGWDLSVIVPPALRNQQASQLANEEGVAATALPQPRGELGCRHRLDQVPDHRLDVGRPEARQGELLRRAGELLQLRGCLGVPVGTEQQHRLRGHGACQEPQQPQRWLISPVQVIEHYQHRPSGGQAGQARRYCLEQAKLRVGRRDGVHRRCRGVLGRCRGAHRRCRSGGGPHQPGRLAEFGRRPAGGPQDL